MKIHLVMAPAWDNTFPSVGAPYVVASLKAAGHDVRLFDGNIEAWSRFKARIGLAWSRFEAWDPGLYEQHLAAVIDPYLEELAAEVVHARPDAVGFALMGTNNHPTRMLARRIRQLLPEAKTFGGGHGMTRELGQELVAANVLDSAVIGEGELTTVDLVDSWQRGDSTRVVPGTIQRDRFGEVRFGEPRPAAKLDELPPPDFTGIPFEKFEYSSLYGMKGALPVVASRGCVLRCTFCSEHAMWSKYRFRTADNVMHELREQARRYGAQEFIFMDSLVNGHHKQLVELTRLMIEEPVRYKWGGQARLDKRLDDRLLGDMARAGCQFLIFGFESGSQRVVDAMGKNFQVPDALRIIRAASKHGMRVYLNVIVGFPNETFADFLRTLRALFRIRRCVAGVCAHRLRMHFDSPMYQNPEKFDVVVDDDLSKERWRLSDGWSSRGGANHARARAFRYRLLVAFLKWLGVPTLYQHLDLATVKT
ncbi:MAG: B12-binding domain-containing radical SAM protein [Planctomycetes bacterium]|nr:B12-binding domain-containing radical SAM protein [Planctomycetota bacterium]